MARRLGIVVAISLLAATVALLSIRFVFRTETIEAEQPATMAIRGVQPTSSAQSLVASTTAARNAAGPSNVELSNLPASQVPDVGSTSQGVASGEALAPESGAVPLVASTGPVPRVVTTPRVPSKAELEAAMKATRIVMYSTTWCPACANARAFLRANGLNYVEHDIDSDPRSLEELKRRTGAAKIPVLEIDGVLLRAGFSERETIRALTASVERRVGVTGLRIERR